MNCVEIRYSVQFNRELRRVRTPGLSRRVERVIEELKSASNITEVRNVRKMAGSERHYRIRIGDYRMGMEIDGNVAILLRFGRRGQVYRDFP